MSRIDEALARARTITPNDAPPLDVPAADGKAVAIGQLDDERLGQGIAERRLLIVAGQDRKRRGVTGAG